MRLYLTGVGGQGLVTFASVLGQALVNAGIMVSIAETHGLSQRGGSVDVHINIGDVKSPIIPRGGADVIVAFELIEALRALTYANKRTLMIVNRRIINSPLIKKIPSPESIEGELKLRISNLFIIGAFERALSLSNALFENMIMLGATYALTDLKNMIKPSDIKNAIIETIGRAVDKNIEAFNIGVELGLSMMH